MRARPRAEKPIPAPGSKYTFFDTIRAAGVDVMQIAPRASTHLDWTRFAGANPFGPSIDHGVYSEMVASYYTVAWLDRYVAPSSGASSRKAERTSKAVARSARCGTSPPAAPTASIGPSTSTRSAQASSTPTRRNATTSRPATFRSRSVGYRSGTCCRSNTTRGTSSTAGSWSATTCGLAASEHEERRMRITSSGRRVLRVGPRADVKDGADMALTIVDVDGLDWQSVRRNGWTRAESERCPAHGLRNGRSPLSQRDISSSASRGRSP